MLLGRNRNPGSSHNITPRESTPRYYELLPQQNNNNNNNTSQLTNSHGAIDFPRELQRELDEFSSREHNRTKTRIQSMAQTLQAAVAEKKRGLQMDLAERSIYNVELQSLDTSGLLGITDEQRNEVTRSQAEVDKQRSILQVETAEVDKQCNILQVKTAEVDKQRSILQVETAELVKDYKQAKANIERQLQDANNRAQLELQAKANIERQLQDANNQAQLELQAKANVRRQLQDANNRAQLEREANESEQISALTKRLAATQAELEVNKHQSQPQFTSRAGISLEDLNRLPQNVQNSILDLEEYEYNVRDFTGYRTRGSFSYCVFTDPNQTGPSTGCYFLRENAASHESYSYLDNGIA